MNDTFANIDPVYVFNVGKAAVGALQHFAVASTANSILGVQDVPASQKLSEAVHIYPNPAKNQLTVEFPQKTEQFKIEISDMTGNTVLRSENQNKIDTTSLINGAYMVSIKTDKSHITKKIIINK